MGRKDSTRKSKDQDTQDDTSSWTCNLCKQTSKDDRAEMMECEYCTGHYCRGCLELSQAEYKLLCKRSDLHWYCPPCEEKAMKNLKVEKDIEERCKAYFQKYESRLEKLEQLVAQKPNLEEVKTLIENKPDLDQVKAIVEDSKSMEATGGAESVEAVEQKLDELKDSMTRRNNIIIFKAEESKEKDNEKRKEDDHSIVMGLCEITGVNQESVKNITRLGKRIEDADRPRPIKVILDGEKSKNQLMANLRKLSVADEKYKSLSIVHDMTKKEREDASIKHKEVQEKNRKESGDYKFVLKGPPWDRRVAKIKKQHSR